MSQRVKVIQPAGVLDGTRGSQLRQDIAAAIADGAKAVLIDLQQISFMDSSGLGSLVAALKTARSAGAELYICSITDQVEMLFELTHMSQVFNILPNQEAFKTTFSALL